MKTAALVLLVLHVVLFAAYGSAWITKGYRNG